MAPPILENLTAAALTVFALALTLVALRAWRHTRSPKILLLTVGFGLFFIKGVVISVLLFREVAWEESVFLPSLLLDLVILAVFYAAVIKRSRV
jgi:hypothetical protein